MKKKVDFFLNELFVNDTVMFLHGGHTFYIGTVIKINRTKCVIKDTGSSYKITKPLNKVIKATNKEFILNKLS